MYFSLLERRSIYLGIAHGTVCMILSGSGTCDITVNDCSGNRPSSLGSQHVPKSLCKSCLLKMQAFATRKDKNTFSYVCNLGLKVSRADSGRTGKFIKSLFFLFSYAFGQLKHLINAPTINSTTCIHLRKCVKDLGRWVDCTSLPCVSNKMLLQSALEGGKT